MSKFLLQVFSGKDNQTPEIARILWFLGVLVYFGLAISAEMKGQPWNPVEFATGLGIVLVGGGVGVAVKAKTEPGT